MMRGRGGRPLNRSQLRAPFKTLKPHVTKRPFDLTMCEDYFPRVSPLLDDDLQNSLEKRLTDIVPLELELNNLKMMVEEIKKVFDALIATPSNFSGCQIEEYKQVGSAVKGTILRGHKTADIVVVLQTLPFQKSIQVLAARVLEDLKKLKSLPQVENYTHELNENGFIIIGSLGSISIRIATLVSNYTKLDSNVHLPLRVLENHAAAIKHVHWFEENANIDKVKNLIRLLKDLKNRFDGLVVLNPWMIDLLAYKAVTYNPRKEAFSESVAYKRTLKLLAAGLFLIGSTGVADPCDNNKWLHNSMSFEHQDLLCSTAQSLVRILSHGGIVPLLTGKSDLLISPTVWNGIIMTTSTKAYEKPTEKEATVEEMEVSAGET